MQLPDPELIEQMRKDFEQTLEPAPDSPAESARPVSLEVVVKGDHLLLAFGQPISGLELTPNQALSLAMLLRRRANKIKAEQHNQQREEKRKSKRK